MLYEMNYAMYYRWRHNFAVQEKLIREDKIYNNQRFSKTKWLKRDFGFSYMRIFVHLKQPKEGKMVWRVSDK